MKYLILYHANCIDGITSAAVTHKYLVEKQGIDVDAITTLPMNYDDKLLPLTETIVALDMPTVYIVDFSFPKQDLINMARYCTRVYLYDHHASAFRNLISPDYEVLPDSWEDFDLNDNIQDRKSVV